MKTIFAAVAGFAVAFMFLTSSAFQASTVARSWPPHPKEMVNWLGLNELPGTVTIPGGGQYAVHQVPTDRWLVMTAVGPTPTTSSSGYVQIHEV